MRLRSLALGLFAAVSGVALCTQSGAATTDPSALVASIGVQINQVLADGSLSASDRRQRFHDIIDQRADFPRISCFVLGRYWQGSSDSFRREFSRVFEDYVIQTMISRFTQYSGDSFYVTGTHPEGEHSTVVLTTVNYPNGVAAARVDWRLRATPDGFKIVDVSDSGVSLAQTYRDEFAAVIARDGGQVAALIPDMRQKLDGQSASSASGTARFNAAYTKINECTP
jgi:phospholipid transport system substrate-binding protein